jgi:hypothetical protein
MEIWTEFHLNQPSSVESMGINSFTLVRKMWVTEPTFTELKPTYQPFVNNYNKVHRNLTNCWHNITDRQIHGHGLKQSIPFTSRKGAYRLIITGRLGQHTVAYKSSLSYRKKTKTNSNYLLSQDIVPTHRRRVLLPVQKKCNTVHLLGCRTLRQNYL